MQSLGFDSEFSTIPPQDRHHMTILPKEEGTFLFSPAFEFLVQSQLNKWQDTITNYLCPAYS